MVGAPLPSLGQVSGLEDLMYQPADFASRTLPQRGFELAGTNSAKGNAYWQYWWSGQREQCVRVAVNGGRVTQLITTDEHDCNQTVSSAKGPSKGAQVAIAAAAIAGVAALAHKSHESNKDRATQSPQDVAEFERGYRDGLYGQGYHNYNNRPDFSDGYSKGSEKRSAETGYRSNQAPHSGYAGCVNVNDLVGARGASADGELRSRGFTDKGGYQQAGRAHSMWWNAGTRQCLNMTVRDGRVERLEPIAEGNCL
jgi:hypothetical protein